MVPECEVGRSSDRLFISGCNMFPNVRLEDLQIGFSYLVVISSLTVKGGWSGGSKVLGKLPVPGHPAIWIIVWQGPIYCACSRCGWGCLDIFFSRLSFLFSYSVSLGDGPI